MLVVQLLENKGKEKQKNQTRLAHFEQPVLSVSQPADDPNAQDIQSATSQTTPAVMSKVLLETPYFISEPFYFPENEECQ